MKPQEGGVDSKVFGIIASKRRVERRERARLKQVKFCNNQNAVAQEVILTLYSLLIWYLS